MTVPKAPMDKERGAIAKENEVGAAGKASIMQTEAKPKTVEPLSHDHFGLGISASDTGHHPAADGSRHDVSHRPT